MPGVTEIYICQPGQALKEGELVISHDITTRQQAEIDAAYRCRLDKSIARIIYYAVRPDGDFRTLYSYENPKARSPKSRPSLVAGTRAGPTRKRRPPPPTGVIKRLRTLF